MQIAICAMTNNEIKNRVEKALLNAEISYLLKCERQKCKEEQAKMDLRKITFYIEASQKAKAVEIVEQLKSNYLEDVEIFF